MQSNRRGTNARSLAWSGSQLNGERARLICGERCDQSAIDDRRACYRLLLPIHFPRRSDRSVERYSDVTLRLALEFNQAHDHLIALLGFLQRQHSNPRIADLQQRKLFTQSSSVPGDLKRDQRIVQPLRLPVGLALAPADSVPGDSVNEFVVPDILRALVGITAARARSSNQREPDSIVTRLVRSILAIGQDGGAELAFHISQVN